MPAHPPLGRYHGALSVNPRPTPTVSDAAYSTSSFTVSLSASSGAHNSPVTLTVTPDTAWTGDVVVTPLATGMTGAFSPTSRVPNANRSTGVTFAYTPTVAGSGSLSASVPGLTLSGGTKAYTAT